MNPNKKIEIGDISFTDSNIQGSVNIYIDIQNQKKNNIIAKLIGWLKKMFAD